MKVKKTKITRRTRENGNSDKFECLKTNITSENHEQSSLKMEYTVYPLFENCNGCLRKVTTVAVRRS